MTRKNTDQGGGPPAGRPLDGAGRVDNELPGADDTAFYRFLADNTSDGIVTVDESGTVVYANAAVEAILGYAPDELVGDPLVRIVPERLRDDHTMAFERHLATGERHLDWTDLRLTGRHRDGHDVPLSVTFRKVRMDGDRLFTGILKDLTEQKARERQLERHATIQTAVGDAIYQLDTEGRIVSVNDVIVEMTGYTRDELVGQHVSLLLDDDEALERHQAGIRRMLAGEETVTITEFVARTADGEAIFCENRYTLLREDGELQGTIGIVRDVTDRKMRERALRESERRLSTLIGNVPGVVFRNRRTADWPMEFVSAGCEPLTGYSPEEIESGDVDWSTDITHPEDQERVWETATTGIREDGEFEVTYRIVTREEDVKWVWERAKAVYDDRGELVAAEGYVTDVTERQRTREQLRREKEQFESLVGGVHDYAIFMLDTEGTVISWNEGAEHIKGYREDEIVGEHFSAFYTEAERARGAPERNIEAALRDGRAEDEGWRVRADGSTFWANVIITPLWYDDGSLRGFAKVTRDLTEQRRAERERELLHAITQSTAEAETFDAGLTATIENVCQWTDWEYGEAWVPSADGSTLERAPAAHATDPALESFSELSSGMTFASGEGLPGTVWESGEPRWVSDASAGGEGFHRSSVTDDANIGATIGVPISTASGTVAVLVFCMLERREVDERQLETVSSVAAELGGLMERKRTEQVLAEERRVLDRILSTSPVGMLILDGEGKLERINPHGRELFGIPDDETDFSLIGRWEAYDAAGERLPIEERPISRVLDTAEPVHNVDLAIERDDGSRQWLGVSAAPILSPDAEVEQVILAVEDITERKEYEAQLERSKLELESELNEIFGRVSDAFFALDDEWRFTYVNEQAATLLERSADDLVGEDIWVEFPDAMESTFYDQYHEAMETQAPMVFEEYYGPLDIWVEVRAYPSASGLSVYFRDVTERKERERELERYETVVENIRDGIYMTDADRRFTMVNDAYVELTEHDREELIGKPVSTIIGESAAEQGWEHIEEMLTSDRDVTVSVGSHHSLPDDVYVENWYTLLPHDGTFEGTTGVVRDITERKRLEDELRQSVEALNDLHAVTSAADRSLDEKLGRLLEIGCERLDLPIGFLATVDRDRDEFRIVEALGDHELLQPAAVAPLSETYCRRTVETDGLLGFRDAAAAGWTGDPADETYGLGCYLGGTIEVDGEQYGTLCFGARDTRERAFTDAERTFVELTIEWVEYELERQTRERELRARVQQQGAVTNLGQRALETSDLDTLFDQAVEAVAETLDNDYCKVLDLQPDGDALLLRTGVGWTDGLVGTATVGTELDSQAGYTLLSEHPVVVEDLRTETRFSGPALLTDHDVVSGISVIIGPQDDPWGVLGTHDRDRKAFSENDVNFIRSVATILATAIERVENEHQLEHQQQHLAAINRLNEVIQNINEALVEQSTRQEIEQLVCDRLAAFDAYEFAWIGEVDRMDQTVTLRTEAGVENYLNGITVTVDDRAEGQGPTGRAVRTGEVQVVRNVLEDPTYEPWRDTARKYGFRSSAAIPLVYEDVLYGVLNLYSARSDAFGEEERSIVAQLGTVVGHAISAVERVEALMSDSVVELELLVRSVSASGDWLSADTEAQFVSTVPAGDGTFLQYVLVSGPTEADFHARTADFPSVEEIRHIDDRSQGALYEIRYSEPPILSTIAELGGHIRSALVRDGDLHIVTSLPHDADIRAIVRAAESVFPDVDVVAQRSISRSEIPDGNRATASARLTDKQRAALEAAYFSGYFDQPRASTGVEVAESLGITASTFHQHLQAGLRKLAGVEFDHAQS